LHAAGRRFRLHRKDLPGKPDIVLPRDRTAVLVHGCFWHGHEDCPIARVPKTQTDFWTEKFAKNRARDLKVKSELESLGWRVVVIWECETTPQKLSGVLAERGLI
jgi:DNA mismatch endonuclease (patch repair protein)